MNFIKLDTQALKKFEFLFLGLMLLSLHLALMNYPHNTALSSSLLLVHLGSFLLWQPLLTSETSFNSKTILMGLLFIVILFNLLHWWFIALWIIFLCGLAGGSALIQGFSRLAYAIATVLLFLELSLTITPGLFELDVISADINDYINYVFFFICISLMFWPGHKARIVQIDYLHSLVISFGLFALYISSILVSFTNKQHYLESLFTTTLLLSLFLLLISLLLFPRRRLSAVGQLWEQHILNIGNPFEHWVNETALLGKNSKINPGTFLQYSIEHLLQLPWVAGIQCSASDTEEFHGALSPHKISFREKDLSIALYSHMPMGGALKIHAQLLLQLMAFFYMSKQRELTLQNQTHLKAVYETGSKLTHDIKNILQSLQTLTSIITTSDDPEQSHLLVEKQLPLLTQRLQNTLDKLQIKTDTGQSYKLLTEWWPELQSRYHGRNIQFTKTIENDIKIDTDVFDTIIENLLENARSKRRVQADVDVTANLVSTDDTFFIETCDTGQAMTDAIVTKLFNQILPSADGYGIGLYQSAQLARRNGYDLSLKENRQGNVCFSITKLDQGS